MSATRGLAPFDEPVYLERSAHDDGVAPPPDGTPRPAIAFVCRAGLLTVLAAFTPHLVDVDVPVGLPVLVAAHVPVTAALDAWRARSKEPPLAHACTAVALDIITVTAFAAVADRVTLLTTVGLLLIAFHRWLYGRITGTLSVVLVTACTVGLLLADEAAGDWFDVAAVGGVGALLVWLVDDQATRQTATSRGLQLASNRAVAIVEGIGDAIVSTDAVGVVRDLNPAAARTIGRSVQDARGARCEAALALEADGRPLSCADGCPLLRSAGSAIEVARTGPQGNRQPLLASAVALCDSTDHVVEVVHLFRDITSLKQAEEAKTLFLATASHELKTPLAVIRGYAQLLQMLDMDDDEKDIALRSIEARSGQLVGIVDRLLMSSRIESGKIDLLPTVGPVGDVLRRRTDDFGHTFRTIEVAVPEELPEAVREPAALATIIDHLLENADKYSPHGGRVGLEATYDDDEITICVTDEGIGMTDLQRDRCFDRFWQAEGTDVRRFGGTGIGLYIVRSLVEAMYGSVSVAGNDAGGTTFTVRLPRRFPQTHAPDGTADPTEGEGSMIREFMRQVGVLTETVPRSRA